MAVRHSSVFGAKTSRYHSLRISPSSSRKALQVSESNIRCKKHPVSFSAGDEHQH